MRSPIPIIVILAFVGVMILTSNTNPWMAVQEFPANCLAFVSQHLLLLLMIAGIVIIVPIIIAVLKAIRYDRLDPEFKQALAKGEQAHKDEQAAARRWEDNKKREQEELWAANAQRFYDLLPSMIERAKAAGQYPLVLGGPAGGEVFVGDEFTGYGLPILADNWDTSRRKAREIAKRRGLKARIINRPGSSYRGYGGGEELRIWC